MGSLPHALCLRKISRPLRYLWCCCYSGVATTIDWVVEGRGCEGCAITRGQRGRKMGVLSDHSRGGSSSCRCFQCRSSTWPFHTYLVLVLFFVFYFCVFTISLCILLAVPLKGGADLPSARPHIAGRAKEKTKDVCTGSVRAHEWHFFGIMARSQGWSSHVLIFASTRNCRFNQVVGVCLCCCVKCFPVLWE